MDDVEMLENKIQNMEKGKNVYETGNVVKVLDYMIEVRGLPNVSYFERVEVQDKGYGYVNKIMPNSVMVAMMKTEKEIVHALSGERAGFHGDERISRQFLRRYGPVLQD